MRNHSAAKFRINLMTSGGNNFWTYTTSRLPEHLTHFSYAEHNALWIYL